MLWAESSNEKKNCSLVGKQVEKMIGGRSRWVLRLRGPITWLLSKAIGIDGSRTKTNQHPKTSR
jgi:hypothetical protein